LSSVEDITGEMRRLILKCRSLEAKLEQSIPKKTYQDAIAKLQAVIDKLSEDLSKTREELQKTESLGGRINSMTAQLHTLGSQVSSHNEIMTNIAEKYAVPKDLNAAQARIAELERKLSESVPKEQYNRLLDEIAGIVSVRDPQGFQVVEDLLSNTGMTKLSDFAPVEPSNGEILEIQSKLSEIRGASEAGEKQEASTCN
jgi:DNA repair exonuclease SbcCD ATPase subunit